MKKYKQGELIHSLDDLMQEQFVFLNGGLINFGWFQNWQLRFALNQVRNKNIHKAIKIQEE